MAIRAIETHYNGYRFRSRLEARYAVFFDSLGLQWTYEPEGFAFNGTKYLPDFYIKTWGCYAEIKPDVSDSVNQANDVCEKFTSLTRKSIMLIIGLPDDMRAVLYENGMWSNNPQPCIRSFVDLSKLNGFDSAVLSAKSARFEHGENPTQREHEWRIAA